MKAAVLRSLNCSLNPYSFFLDPACICSSSGPCFQSLRPFWPSRTKETSRSGIILISLGLKLDQVSYPMGTRDKFFVRRFLPSRISPCSFLLLLYLRTPQLNNLKAATAAKIFLGSTGKLFYFYFFSLRPMKRNGNIHRTFLFISIFCRFIGIFISQSSWRCRWKRRCAARLNKFEHQCLEIRTEIKEWHALGMKGNRIGGWRKKRISKS